MMHVVWICAFYHSFKKKKKIVLLLSLLLLLSGLKNSSAGVKDSENWELRNKFPEVLGKYNTLDILPQTRGKMLIKLFET